MDLNVHTIEPVGYLEMVYLLKHCEYVLTDSGGVQKEAYFFRKRCIVLRDETEWTELVECGANQLVGAVRLDIMSAVAKSTDGIDFDREFYGAGSAANKIVEYLHNYRAT